MDNERLKKMLSAWFDNELSPVEMAEVEAFIAQSEEAKQIVAEYRAVNKLTEQNQTSQADYWERSAAKIEAAVASATDSKITPVRKSGWSNWTVKALSIAASISILTFIGLNQSEIIDSMGHKQTSPEVREEAPAEIVPADSMRLLIESPAESLSDDADYELKENYKSEKIDNELATDELKKLQLVKPDDDVIETTRSELDEISVRGGRAGEVGYLVDGEPDESEPDKSEPAAPVRSKSIANEPLSLQESSNQISLTGMDIINKPVTRKPESLVAEKSQPSKQKGSIETTTTLAESVVTDSLDLVTAVEMLEVDRSEIRYRQLWERDILTRLTTIKRINDLERASKTPIYTYDAGGGDGIAQGLAAAEKRAKDSGKKSVRKNRTGSASQSDSAKVAAERELLEAAFYIGSTNIYEKEYNQAIRYLRWMAKTNKGTLNRKHAKNLLNELEGLYEE